MLWLWLVTTVSLSGCSTAGYYAQSISGQMHIWRETRPIEVVLVDPEVQQDVKRKLRLALDIRRFGVEALGLPDNDSYTEFVDLGRPYVVWSVFAAPELSLVPEEWCFLVVGCVTYRGYFDKQDALDFAGENAERGFDVYVGGVAAYSTLGWFDDPVPNTILGYPDEDFSGLIFHELAHQVAFAKGDTVFNESFASTVERVGVERWLSVSGESSRIATYNLQNQRNEAVVGIILKYRARLETLYGSDGSDQEKRDGKANLIRNMKEEYVRSVSEWPGYAGYKHWFSKPINNAQLLSVATYNDLVPEFETLLRKMGDDLPRFYEAVRELADMEKSRRRAVLDAL
jgi:predicted aminopeptidase